MRQYFLDKSQAHLIIRLRIVKGFQKLRNAFNGIIIRIERIVVCSARYNLNVFIVKHILSGRIKTFGIINLNIIYTALDLSNDRVIRRIYIREQLIKMLVNINHHHARITVISKHSAVLPHCICLRFLACSCIVDSLQSRKCNTSAERVSSDNDIASLSICRAVNLVSAVHYVNIDFIVHNKALGFAEYNIIR